MTAQIEAFKLSPTKKREKLNIQPRMQRKCKKSEAEDTLKSEAEDIVKAEAQNTIKSEAEDTTESQTHQDSKTK